MDRRLNNRKNNNHALDHQTLENIYKIMNSTKKGNIPPPLHLSKFFPQGIPLNFIQDPEFVYGILYPEDYTSKSTKLLELIDKRIDIFNFKQFNSQDQTHSLQIDNLQNFSIPLGCFTQGNNQRENEYSTKRAYDREILLNRQSKQNFRLNYPKRDGNIEDVFLDGYRRESNIRLTSKIVEGIY